MRILVVEDDKKIASFVQNGLRQAGFAVDYAGDGAEGLHLALTVPYDAAVVDIMLLIRDGLSMIEQIRHRKINTPVIILSAKRTVDERVYGLQVGGDDYMIKPFAFSELLARIQGLIRRSTGTLETTRITTGDLSIDLLKREASLSGKPIELQPRESSLLEFLMRNAGRIVSKTMILEHIWDYSFDPQTNVVDVLVCRLRSKLDKEGVQKIIRTVRGAGVCPQSIVGKSIRLFASVSPLRSRWRLLSFPFCYSPLPIFCSPLHYKPMTEPPSLSS